MMNINEPYSPISDDELFSMMTPTIDYEITDEVMKEFFDSDPFVLSNNEVAVTLKSVSVASANGYHSKVISAILQTPDFLSVQHIKEQLQDKLQQRIHLLANTMETETLQMFAIFFYQLDILNLEIDVWNHYLQLGTNNLAEGATNSMIIWPSNIKTMILLARSSTVILDSNVPTVNDNDYLEFVQEHLRSLYAKQEELKQELITNKCSFPNFTSVMEHIMKTFIAENTKSLRLHYDYQNKFIDFEYQDQLFDYKFYQQKPTVAQAELSNSIFTRKYQYEIIKQEFLWTQKQINNNNYLKELNSIQLSLSSTFQSVANINLRENLTDRCRHVLKRYQQDMSAIVYDTMEARLNELHNAFESVTATMWLIQQSFPVHLRMNQTMIDLIDHHLPVLSEKAKYIYEYKNAVEGL